MKVYNLKKKGKEPTFVGGPVSNISYHFDEIDDALKRSAEITKNHSLKSFGSSKAGNLKRVRKNKKECYFITGQQKSIIVASCLFLALRWDIDILSFCGHNALRIIQGFTAPAICR